MLDPACHNRRAFLARSIGCLMLAAMVVPACSSASEERPPASLGELIDSLSGAGGYFDTDNLISNESSYGPAIARLEQSGGVYLGVGPEQNYSYIARSRPSWAFLVDVRRDNMLQHLLFNAVLARAPSPYLYLCLLFSLPCPDKAPREASPDEGAVDLQAILAKVETLEKDPALFERNLELFLDHIESGLGVSLSSADRAYIETTHRTFFEQRLELRFRSHGRPSRWHYPTYRDLLLERTPSGEWANFLADRQGYAHLRRLAQNGRLVPVVGDLAGPHALKAIGQFLKAKDEAVSVLYVSNVEFYLLRSRAFGFYVENLRALPLAPESVLIRSYFDYGMPHPLARPGEHSTLVIQRTRRFLELEAQASYRSYWDVCTRDYLP